MSFYQKGDEVRVITDDYKKDNVREGDLGQYLEPVDTDDLSQALAKMLGALLFVTRLANHCPSCV